MKQGTLFVDPASVVDDAGSGRDSGRGRPASKVADDAPPCAGSLSCDADPGRDEAPCPGGLTPPSASLPEPAGPRSKAARIVALAHQGVLIHEERGELDVLLDRHLKTNSPELLEYLYGDPPRGWGFAKRYIKDGSRNTTRLARSLDALLATYRLKQDRRLELCLLLSDRLTQQSFLNAPVDRDGRARFSLGIAGTKIGRMACHKSTTGNGLNLHGAQDRHRGLFGADPGFDLYQVDLKAADGWTLGAEAMALGDPRMWNDLSAGLKPANAVVLLFKHGPQVNQWPMDRCLEAQAKLSKSEWTYKACKIGIWGRWYGLAEVTLAEDILERSWKSGEGLVVISVADVKRLISFMDARYPGINRRIERVKMLLKRDGYLVAASGLRRDFFGRKTDASTIRDALPFTPAANTAHATNCALRKLWEDPEREAHQVQPMFTQHDSLLFQAPKEHRAWVQGRIPQWFNNALSVAGTTFVIPWETCRGDSWGSVKPL